MNRIDRIIRYLQNYIYEDNLEMRSMYLMHIFGVAQFASMIALKRGLNPEIATISALLHDIHTLDTLDPEKHAKKGALLARSILNEMNITDDKETDIICTAIHNHSSKAKVHGEYDELLKDADVLQHCLYNTQIPPSMKDEERFRKLLAEFSLKDPRK